MSSTSLFGSNLQSETVKSSSTPTIVSRFTKWMTQPMANNAHHFGGHYIGNRAPSNHSASTLSTPPPSAIAGPLYRSQFSDYWIASGLSDLWMRPGLSSKTDNRTGLETDTNTLDVTNTAVTLSQTGLPRRRASENKAYCFGANRFGRFQPVR